MEKETHKSKVGSRHRSIKEAISQLQLKGAIKIVQEQPNQFTSTLFVVKQASKERPIFNLKNLNRYVQPCKFKMEGLDTARKLIQPGDFMMKLDLQDPYFSVPIHDSYKHYLRFIFQGTTRVAVPPIRAFQCTPDIHQSIETSHFTAAIAGDTNCNISGRHAHFGSESRQIGLGVSQHCECAKTTGLSYQAGKMLLSSNKTHRISGFPDQLHRHAASTTEREAPKHSGRMQEGIPESFYVDDSAVSPSRQNDRLHTNRTGTGSIALPCTTATAHKHTAPPEDKLPEQDQDFLIKGRINRPPMVDLISNNSIQQHSINPTSVRYGHIHGCIHTGMGGPMQWNIDGGTLDSPGIQEPHQRSRVKSCPTGHQVLSSHSNTEATAHQSTDGQFCCSCLRQQERRNQVINAGGVSGRAMGSLPSEQHMDNSTTPSWNSECRCRLGLNGLWTSQFLHV